jgi:hypothetical protein
LRRNVWTDGGIAMPVLSRNRLIQAVERMEKLGGFAGRIGQAALLADEDNLELMYADLGKSHPGFDCFVIKKQLISSLILDNICVGIPFVEVALVHNLFSFATKPLFLPDAHLTFHIGLDVMPERNKDFYWHNRLAYFTKVQPILKPHFNLSKFPYAALAMHKRAIKWVLNPGLFTRNYLELETKSIGKKLKYLINEWRWNFLQK